MLDNEQLHAKLCPSRQLILFLCLIYMLVIYAVARFESKLPAYGSSIALLLIIASFVYAIRQYALPGKTVPGTIIFQTNSGLITLEFDDRIDEACSLHAGYACDRFIILSLDRQGSKTRRHVLIMNDSVSRFVFRRLRILLRLSLLLPESGS